MLCFDGTTQQTYLKTYTLRPTSFREDPLPTTPLRLVSLLSGTLTPFYQALTAHLASYVPGAAFLALPWQEGLHKLETGEVEGAFLCGLLYAQHKSMLEPLVAPVPRGPRYGGRPVYFADIVARAEFSTLESLRGARWAYNDPGSFSGYAALLAHLTERGEGLGFFGSLSPSGSHLRSLELLRAGEADAATLDSTVLDGTEQTGLRIVTSLGPYPAPPLGVRRDLDPTKKEKMRTHLLALHQEPEGRALIAQSPFSSFVTATDADYDVLKRLAERASEALRIPSPSSCVGSSVPTP